MLGYNDTPLIVTVLAIAERALILMCFPLPAEQVVQKSAVRPNDFWSRARKFCGPPKINTEQKLNGAQSAAENLLNILSANHSLGHHQVDTIN